MIVHLQIQAYESSTVDRKEMIHRAGFGGHSIEGVSVEGHVRTVQEFFTLLLSP